MNQLDVHDPDGDVLRRALTAEAEGVTADDALAARVAAAVGRDTRRRRRTSVLALAAAALVVVGLVAVTRPGNGDDVRTDETTPASAPASRPHLIALVRDDGWLVTFDTRTGEQRELSLVGAPESDGRSLPPTGVAMSPDGRWVYFARPLKALDSASTYRVATAGGEPELISTGRSPAISPDGRLVAAVDGDAVVVTRSDGGTTAATQTRFATGGTLAAGVSWSPDGSKLAYTVEGPNGTEAWVVRVRSEPEGVTLGESEPIPDPARPGEPAGLFLAWSPEGEPSVMGPALNAYGGLTQDASGRWLLWLSADGVLQAQEWGSDQVVPIPDVPRVLAADW